MNIVDDIFELFEKRGQQSYFGEHVSQLDHALQCAYLATQEHASNDLIAAALLHDLGHLLHSHGEQAADRGIDTAHENLAESWLSRYFGPAITRPISLHVAAKRYLCTTDATYLSELSPASRQSLELQGGLMTAQEVRAFEGDEFSRDSVRLRKWDDLAKVPGAQVPPLGQYRKVLESVADRP